MKTKTIFLIAALVITCLFNKTVNAKSWRVNNLTSYAQWTNQEVFTDINTAINDNNVKNGDTLLVEGNGIGLSYGTITLTKKLVLIGSGYFLNENPGLQNNSQSTTALTIDFKAGSSGSTISGFYLVGADSGPVYSLYLSGANLADVTITRCRLDHGILLSTTASNNIIISKNYCSGIYYNVGNVVTNLIITNNFFNSLDLGINYTGSISQNVIGYTAKFYSGLSFFNNIIVGNGNGAVVQNNNSTNNVYNNLFVVAQTVVAWLPGSGTNIFSIPSTTIFDITTITSTDGKLHVKPNNSGGCPKCYIGYPSGTSEVGIFGGADPYILSGIPTAPTIYFLGAPANAIQGGNAPTDIKTRSNN